MYTAMMILKKFGKWIYEYRNKNNIKMGVYVSAVNNSKSKVDYENINKYIKPYCDNFSLRDVSNQGGSMMELNDSENIKEGNILGSLKNEEFTTGAYILLIVLL